MVWELRNLIWFLNSQISFFFINSKKKGVVNRVLDKELLDYVKRFIDFQAAINENSYYAEKISEKHVTTFLRPSSKYNKDLISLLPYEDRIEIAKIYLKKLIDDNLIRMNYYKGVYSGYSYKDFKDILSTKGCDCYLKVVNKDDNENPIDWEIKTENFHQMFLDGLYKKWDESIDTWKDENKQTCVEMMFEFQLTGTWLYYNGFNQNFLKVYLEYLKNRGYKINIFEIFKKKIKTTAERIEQGTSHFSKSYLFECLIIIFDFYMAILDLYGDNNQKVINKLQNTLNSFFREKLNVEKMGFMNTFLYTKYYVTNNHEGREDVGYFWSTIYNDKMNPTMKRIFINALVYTWNKSPIPKVRNSIQLIAKLSTYSHIIEGRGRGFPYGNQGIFYKDLILNANSLKKSVKSILFSKAIAQEGGLYLGG